MSTEPVQFSNLCLFGGAFDPPHLSHRRLAMRVPSALDADLVVLPTGDHPHKRASSMTPAAHRLAMCERAFEGLPRVHVDDREIRQTGPSYSLLTVRAFRRELGPKPTIFWLIGSDNLSSLPGWHRHHELLEEVTVVTFPRSGRTVDARALAELDLTASERRSLLANVLPFTADDRSATRIRAALARGDDPTTHADLCPAVAAYISRHQLYR